MKITTKLVLFFAVSFVSNLALAQIPNAGFETWNSMGSYSNPDKWDNINAMTTSMSVYTCQQGTPGNPGSSILKLTSKTVTGMGVKPGVAVSGVINMSTFKPKSGFALSSQPASLTGSWQYMAGGSDMGYVSVVLTKWNAAMMMHDTIATALKPLSGMVMSWAAFTINLSYRSAAMPDSAMIILSASGATPANNSYLYVDNLAFSGSAAGITESNLNAFVSVYPNPAQNILNIAIGNTGKTISKMEIFDIQGKMIRNVDVKPLNSLTSIDIADLSTGIYILKLTSDDGIATRRFSKN